MKILIALPKRASNRRKSGAALNFTATVVLALGIVYVSTSPALELIERADAVSTAVSAEQQSAAASEDDYIAASVMAAVEKYSDFGRLKPALIKPPEEQAVPSPPEEPVSVSEEDVAAFIETMHMPLDGVITSEVGERKDPFGSGATEYHSGTDIAVTDDYAVRAADAGVVTEVGYDDSYGNYMVIDHGNGISTLYAHCEYIYLGEGDNVTRGMLIGKAGITGRATGVHLHFEVLT